MLIHGRCQLAIATLSKSETGNARLLNCKRSGYLISPQKGGNLGFVATEPPTCVGNSFVNMIFRTMRFSAVGGGAVVCTPDKVPGSRFSPWPTKLSTLGSVDS